MCHNVLCQVGDVVSQLQEIHALMAYLDTVCKVDEHVIVMTMITVTVSSMRGDDLYEHNRRGDTWDFDAGCGGSHDTNDDDHHHESMSP